MRNLFFTVYSLSCSTRHGKRAVWPSWAVMLETLMVTFKDVCLAAADAPLEYFALTDCQSQGEPAEKERDTLSPFKCNFWELEMRLLLKNSTTSFLLLLLPTGRLSSHVADVDVAKKRVERKSLKKQIILDLKCECGGEEEAGKLFVPAAQRV